MTIKELCSSVDSQDSLMEKKETTFKKISKLGEKKFFESYNIVR